jgi:hypothetical protein
MKMPTPHEVRLQQLSQLELEAYRRHHKLVTTAQNNLKKRLRNIEAKRDRLTGHEDDPEVLVRTGAGPTVEIYHDAVDYCRRVNPSAVAGGRYERVLLFEAKERGLRPCTACAWNLKSRRRPTSGAA